MITPQEVSERAFSKASFGGYNMAQVDEFLDLLTTDYSTLYKENAVLKSKMKVLVDKVEEYRATEDAMRKTLLSAQKMAASIVAEAEEQRAAAIRGAEGEARRRIGDLQREVEAEEFRLAAAKEATAAYLDKLKGLFDQHLDYLGHLSELAAPPAPAPDPVQSAVREIETTVSRLTASPAPEEPEEVLPEEDPEDTKEIDLGAVLSEAPAAVPDRSAKGASRFQIINLTVDSAPEGGAQAPDFSNLQFGRDYEIK